jgi:F-type H+-transporting ATPase subunit b
MPQLDQTMWPPQLFWLAVCFIALYIIVLRIIIPRTGGAIEARKGKIEGDLAAAVSAKSESEAALNAYEASLADARGKASASSLAARNKISAEADQARHKLDAELAGKASAADKAIQAAKSKALGNIAEIASDLATNIVAELSGAKVTKAEASAAVAKATK